MDPSPVFFSDCIERCPAFNPVTGTACFLYSEHPGPHELGRVERPIVYKRVNQITDYGKRRWETP